MRRRIRSAAFPVHRHSLPQLLVDGLLVALAYFLAFRLRFDWHVHGRYQELFEATIPWVIPVFLVVLAAFGLYQRLWSFISQREYEAVLKGVLVATFVVVGAIALFHPVQTAPHFRHFRQVSSAGERHRAPPPP
jgi:FlaA1/EpsC-like NDP-sugar epimerase